MGMVYSVVLGVCAFGFFGCGGFDVLGGLDGWWWLIPGF